VKNTLRIPWNGGNQVETEFLEGRGWIPLEIVKRSGVGGRIGRNTSRRLEELEKEWRPNEVKESVKGFEYPEAPDLSSG
jgi:hypothetical protein